MTHTVRLRGHHLLCILTYVGRGYTPHFVARMDEAVRRIAAGAPVEIVEGPDDLCAALIEEGSCHGDHCATARVRERDDLARAEIAALLGLPHGANGTLVYSAQIVARLRAAFAAGSIRSACAGCDWKGLCDGLAETGYPEARLQK
ncbi:DUF1284 domain-containing protein [Chelatococcus sp. SYSU_G07232]|uniref:DUF1284 domain-containing protein n=1 Tax=Chelatococcus albus TaxID=3047466 RepID=A0ABT7AC51_9HYPH|nr:DUF1284 domain-containing protein [Chelatococcus sp. SYSU_G07232]MDJ1156947.1 DUF1284 domain-containing protein [Chelatococcus sp. SYSU_G07232]